MDPGVVLEIIKSAVTAIFGGSVASAFLTWQRKGQEIDVTAYSAAVKAAETVATIYNEALQTYVHTMGEEIERCHKEREALLERVAKLEDDVRRLKGGV